MTLETSSSHVARPAMYRGCARPLLGLLLCVSLSGGRLGAELAFDGGRPSMSLDGLWQFRIDPNDEGTSAGWFNANVPFPETIRVPGNWQAQGFGEPRNHLSHDYQGKAWYRRTVTIPVHWAGQRVWLHLGGVTAVGEVYVNGQPAGSVDHYVTPFEFDITDLAGLGKENVISVQVDSKSGCHDPHRDPIVRPGPVGMFNFWGHWGGLYRSVHLEARSDHRIDTLFVTSNVEKCIAQAKVVLKRSAPGPAWNGTLAVSITPVNGGPTSSAEGTVHFGEGQVESEASVVSVAVKDAAVLVAGRPRFSIRLRRPFWRMEHGSMPSEIGLECARSWPARMVRCS